MQDYKQMLVAIDFTDFGNRVLRQAKYIADKFNAELNVIHVVDNIPMPDTPYGTLIDLDTHSSDSLLQDKKDKFIQVCDEMKIAQGNRWLIWGEPQQEITHLACAHKMDLIIVGSHGRHGLAELLGSAAKGVIFHADCDVLTVHLRENE